MTTFRALLGKFIWPPDRAGRIARIILGLLLVGCVVNLNLSPDPGEDGIAARLATGKKPAVKHYVATYNWYMAAANAVLLTGLLAAIPLWLRPTVSFDEKQDVTSSAATVVTRPDLLTWGLLAASVGALLFFTVPRMDHSLWGDEEYTFRRNIYGEHFRKDAKDYASPLELKRVGWLDTVYGYKKPNNHILQTILSRASHELWLANLPADAQDRERIGEWALRLPSLLAALATLPALVVLGALVGRTRAGAMAAVLLSVHPWFQRYASEARGYALVMFFTVVLAGLLLLALRKGKWRWWMLYGAAQFLLMWCYVGAVFVPLALNLFALAWLIWRRRSQPAWFRSNAPRWLVVNLLSSMCFFQMMLPCLPMLHDYLRDEPMVPEKMDWVWFQDLVGYLLGGMDGQNAWGNAPAYQSWEGLAHSEPVLFAVAVAGTAGLTLLGLAVAGRWGKGGGLAPWLILTWAVAPLAMGIVHGQVTQHYYYTWYLIFALPGYAFIWALGVEKLAGTLGAMTRWPAPLNAGLALAVALVLILPALMNRLLSQQRYSVEPLEESVDLMRGAGAKFPYDRGDTLTAGFVMPSRAYDPAYIEVENAAELSAVAAYAQANGKTLYVAFGALGLAEARLPDIMDALRDESKYREVASLPGTWPFVSRQVYALNPAPLANQQGANP